MEKLKLALQMATRWTDPTMILIGLLPAAITWAGATAYLLYEAGLAVTPVVLAGVAPDEAQIRTLIYKGGAVLLPTAIYWFLWNVCYHGVFEDQSVDTSQFIVFRDPALGRYWKHRRVPMCEVYEWYIREQIDWNPACEKGDCLMVLDKHRHEFVHYKPTFRQCRWLLTQFLPVWLTGSGLGYGSSSGKSIEETTKEIDEHYNKGNDVFSCFLGKAMVYTCGIFNKMPQFASTGYDGDYAASGADGELEKAQMRKMDMICDKLMLKKGESTLDIGCGWGTLARHMARRGAVASGVTLSREGKIWCDMASAKEGVPTEILLCDYRDMPRDVKFNKISAIEMAEHVGINNFVPFLKIVKGLLKDQDSMFLMQVAGLRQGSNWQDVAWGLFMGKYIFPGADASTPLNWYIRQCELAGFEVHSVETIGMHYAQTLHKWYDNWCSHKEDIISGRIDAISEHTKGTHLFRLFEFAWAWATIHAGQGGGTCYQILMHPCNYDFPREQWVDGRYVSGVGLSGETDEPQRVQTRSSAKKTSTKKAARI